MMWLVRRDKVGDLAKCINFAAERSGEQNWGSEGQRSIRKADDCHARGIRESEEGNDGSFRCPDFWSKAI